MYVKVELLQEKSAPFTLTSSATRPARKEGAVQLRDVLLKGTASTTMVPNLHLRDVECTNPRPNTLTIVRPRSGP